MAFVLVREIGMKSMTEGRPTERLIESTLQSKNADVRSALYALESMNMASRHCESSSNTTRDVQHLALLPVTAESVSKRLRRADPYCRVI